MVRSIKLTLIALVIMIAGIPMVTLAQSATPGATPTIQDPSCDEFGPYWTAIVTSWPDDVSAETEKALERTSGVPFGQLASVRSVHLDYASAYFEEYASNIEAIEEVPDVILELHEAYLGRMVLLSKMLSSYSQGEVFAIEFYIEQIADNADRIEGLVETMTYTCGEKWTAFVEASPPAYRHMWTSWYD